MSIASGASAGSMGGPWGALAGAGLGLIQNHTDRVREKDQARANAMLAQVSPWNAIAARMIAQPKKTGGFLNIVGGAGKGYELGSDLAGLGGGAVQNPDPGIAEGSVMDKLANNQSLSNDYQMQGFGSAQRQKNPWDIFPGKKPTYFGG